MHADEDQEMMDVRQLGLSREEAQELRAQLDGEEWPALLAMQHALANAPMLAPSVGFADRVLQSLAARERRWARRRSLIGGSAFALGAILVTSLLFWSSPLGGLTQVSGWAALLDSAMQFAGVAATGLIIIRTFAAALAQAAGEPGLLLYALFALVLTLVWTRLVTGPAPSNHSTHATEVLS